VQVADRFHLLQNLAEALELAFTAQAYELRDIEQARRRAAVAEGASVRPDPPPPPKRPLVLAVARREQRLATHRRVWELWREGWPGRDIARHLGIGRTTTYRYLKSETFPERKGRSDAGRSSVDPWGEWVIARWNTGQHNGRQMLRELRKRGFIGNYATVLWRDRRVGRQESAYAWGSAAAAIAAPAEISRPV
jgi:transposase